MSEYLDKKVMLYDRSFVLSDICTEDADLEEIFWQLYRLRKALENEREQNMLLEQYAREYRNLFEKYLSKPINIYFNQGDDDEHKQSAPDRETGSGPGSQDV